MKPLHHPRDREFVRRLLEQWNNPEWDDFFSRHHNHHRTEINREWVRTSNPALRLESLKSKYSQLHTGIIPPINR